MKKMISILLFVFIALIARTQTLSFQGPNPLLSDDAFIVDLAFTFPINCDKVQATLSFTGNNSCMSWQNILIEGGTFYQGGNTSSIYPPNTSFNQSNSVTTFIITGIPGSSANIQFNLRSKWGEICEGGFPIPGYGLNQITFSSSITFTGSNSGGCGTFDSGNLTREINAYHQWTVASPAPAATRCLGGIFNMTVNLTHPSGYRGAIRLRNPRIYLDLPTGAIVYGVIYLGKPLAFSNSSPGCGSIPQNTTRWSANLPVPNYLQPEISHQVIFKVQFPCGLFQLNTNYIALARLSGTDCCSNGRCLSSTQRSFNFTNTCCNLIITQPTFKKTLVTGTEFCPGGCYEEGVLNKNPQYNIQFSALNTHLPLTNVLMNDMIPAQVDVRKITTPSPPAGAAVELWYATTNTSLTQYVGTVPQHIFVQSNAQMGCNLPGCRVTQLQWRYSTFPAFGTVTNSIDFSLNNTALLNVNVVNTSTASYTLDNALQTLTSTASKKPTACKPNVKLQKWVVNNGSCSYYQSVVPNDVVKFRLNAKNTGSANAINGIMTDVLDNIFDILPQSVVYYYGNQICPPSGAFTSNFTFPGSVLPVSSNVTGQTISVSNVNLPSCDLTNTFVVEFAAKVKPFTPSTIVSNVFNFTGNNITTALVSNTVNVEVNENVLLSAVLEAQCNGSSVYETSISSLPNAPIKYRLRVMNQGNVAVENVTVFNTRPTVGDKHADCLAGPRGSGFNLAYTTVSGANTTPPTYYTSDACNACICGGTQCSPAGGISNMLSMCITMPLNSTLAPGQTLEIIIDGQIPQNSLGLSAFNDFGIRARRVGGVQTPVFTSNVATVNINNTGCGGCVAIENEVHGCVVQNSAMSYSFCIKNNSTFAATQFILTNNSTYAFGNTQLPAGVTVIQNGNQHTYTIPGPGLAPGQSLCGFATQWPMFAGGQTICVDLQLSNGINTCQNPVPYCFTLLDCPNPCLDILNPSFNCQQTTPNTFIKSISFNIKNNGLSCISQFNILGGFGAAGLSQTIVLTSPILQGQTSPTISVTLPSASAGYMCFSILQALCNPLNANDPVCNGDGFCLTAPPCGPMRIGNETPKSGSLSVTPNPVANGILTVTTNTVADDVETQLCIYGIDNRLLQTNSIMGSKEKTIDVSKLSPGMYIVKALQNGKAVYTTKFQKL